MRIHKQSIVAFVLGALLFSVVPVFAEKVYQILDNPFPIKVNGVLKDIESLNIDGFTWIKLTDVGKAFGDHVKVKFNESDKQIEISEDENSNENETYTEIENDGIQGYIYENRTYLNYHSINKKYPNIVLKMGDDTLNEFRLFDTNSNRGFILQKSNLDHIWYEKLAINADIFYDFINGKIGDILPSSTTPVPSDVSEQQSINAQENYSNEENDYIKYGFHIHLDNGIEYVQLHDIAALYYRDKGYGLRYNEQSKMVELVYNPYIGHPYDKTEVIIDNIPYKTFNVPGSEIYIEYQYYINTILPLMK